jgi:ribosomal protein S18 acetylase RimI-like enzyme
VGIRRATSSEIPRLVSALEAFMREAFDAKWHGSASALEAALGQDIEVLLADGSHGELAGFVAWQMSYDLHHCVRGGSVLDLYVVPASRGRGVALALMASVAAAVRERGGVYVRGQAVPKPEVQRVYERLCVLFPGADANVGGRAFRVLADLDGVPPRDAVRRLPPREWNYEP